MKLRSIKRLSWHILTVALLLIVAPALPVLSGASPGQQGIEKSLQDAYKGRTLSLRRFYLGPKLEFDSNGVLVGDRVVGSWTLYCRVFVDDIKLESHVLEIRGHRLSLRYFPQQSGFQASQDGEVQIRVDLHHELSSAQDLEPLFAKIFVTPGENFSALVPPYWREFCSHMSDPGWSEKQVKKARAQASSIRHIFDPRLSKAPRKENATATAALSIVIDDYGHVSDAVIIRPVGMGLDEKAVETVRTWRFEPARRPIPMRILVEIGFHLIGF